MAAGRTTGEVERVLTSTYTKGKLLQEPKITVSVVSFRPFYVFGEVLTPGRYPYTDGLDVLAAVATAGGFTYRASRSSVLIRHPGEEVWQQYSLAAPQLMNREMSSEFPSVIIDGCRIADRESIQLAK